MQETRSYDEAMMWSRDLLDTPNVCEIWLPAEGFVRAVRTPGGLSLTRRDGHLFGMAIGPDPDIDPRWESMALPADLPSRLTEHLELRAAIDVMTAPSTFAPTSATSIVLADPDEIRSFLTLHAPESHTFPGSPEARLWFGVRDDRRLVAVAAMTVWQSGATMLASVATHREYRGQGLATRLAKDSLYYARSGGVSTVALAVSSGNTAAIRAYSKAGFLRLHAMQVFEPASPES